MDTDGYFPSRGGGKLYYRRWEPEGEIRAVVQIVHGIAEHILRYEAFARYLNGLGYLVVAEDHMGHGKSARFGTLGYFDGGWFAAADDTYRLLEMTRQDFPQLPYVLLGHSMGSLLARTLLARHPDSGISACILSGTLWQPQALLNVAIPLCRLVCSRVGERNPSAFLQNLVFSGYNRKVEHPRTPYDWLTRDHRVVDAYVADPLCGFTASSGILRDMLMGISHIQKKQTLDAMERELPVLFVAGSDDPVGNYGKGVRQAARAFRDCGMKRVELKLYPMCRHEILNELNRAEVYRDLSRWMEKTLWDKE